MRLAVVGTGVSGLVCAHLLARRHDVTVYEANDYAGGHTHTIEVQLGGRLVRADTGFIVYNERTYPLFCRLLAQLDVDSQPTDMSFSVRCERSGLEYAGAGLNGVFAQRRNLLRPSFHRMLRDLLRFYREAPALLDAPEAKVTLGDYLAGAGYSRRFVEQHLLPMGAAIWSSSAEDVREFPAVSFVRFFQNHGLLSLAGRPQWRVIRGGSLRYVEALTAGLRGRVRLSCPVRGVRRELDGVVIADARGGRERYDQVVLAAHADQALALLDDASDAERRILAAIRYQRNQMVLHTDASLLPRRRHARASWNYHVPRVPAPGPAVTYWLNRLQRLDLPVDLCVTLNRGDAVDPSRVLRELCYAHPIFDAAALDAQRCRGHISGVRRTHYCGAYWGYGFHEDGVRSAVAVARRLGCEL